LEDVITNLVLSLIALALGPIIYGACRKIDIVRSTLDGLLFVTIAGIVVFHIVPDVYGTAGITALTFMLAGVALAFFVGRWSGISNGDRYSWIIFLGAIGLVVHATMDGIALLPADLLQEVDTHGAGANSQESVLSDFHGNQLALGVILHRIPVGMAIWWTIRPNLGKTVAIGALAIIAVATSAAYIFGGPVLALMDASSIACFKAFVAGTLLHVIVFTSTRTDDEYAGEAHSRAVMGERIGVILGLFLLLLIPHAL
jgi:hypothetical protein